MRLLALLLLSAALPCAASALSVSLAPTADAFVTSGPTGDLAANNYGGAGGLTVAAPGLAKGEAQSVLRFDVGAALAAFDGAFGAGQWSLQSAVLQLTAAAPNSAIFNAPAAGALAISWMQSDAWVEGTGTPAMPTATGITFASLPTYLGAGDESLGAFAYSGATSGAFAFSLALTPGFTADVLAGHDVGLRLFAADPLVSGVFNSRSFVTPASRPSLSLVAVPEPGTLALLAGGVAWLATRRRAR